MQRVLHFTYISDHLDLKLISGDVNNFPLPTHRFRHLYAESLNNKKSAGFPLLYSSIYVLTYTLALFLDELKKNKE